MSKRHQASRRRTYGRRQHELHERRERGWHAPRDDRGAADDGFTQVDAPAPERWTMPYGTTWRGLE